MEGVVILPSNKGNATILMERDEYDRKIQELLNTDTYRELKGDPTVTQEVK